MSKGRDRNGRRGGNSSDDQPGYWDEREAAMRLAEYQELMRYQPHNVDAEAALLGALMIDNRLIETVSQRLRVEHFFEPVHARIYERIVSLSGKGKLVTPITLRPYFTGETIQFMDGQGNTDPNGYGKYCAQLTGSGAGLIGAPQFANQIIDLAHLRAVVTVAQAMGEAAADTKNEVDPRRVIQIAEAELFDIATEAGAGLAQQSVPLSKSWDEAIEDIQQIADGKPAEGFTIAGYDDFNDVFGRMEPGDYSLLGGRPSMGKTGVACAVALGAAAAGEPTEFLSLEMKRKLITRRMIANAIYEQGVTSGYAALSEGKLTRADHAAIARTRADIASYPLNIHDPDLMMVEEFYGWLQRRKRAWAAKGLVLKLCVVDYLDSFETEKQFRSDTERVSYISRTLKSSLRRAGVAGLVLVQLSRGVEQREDKHPHLSDLRQSGSLEQDADVVGFVYRDEYYHRANEPAQTDRVKWEAWQDEMIAVRDRLELYAAKRREGALIKRTGYFFANEQAVRSSNFYRTDLFRQAGSFDFSDDEGG